MPAAGGSFEQTYKALMKGRVLRLNLTGQFLCAREAAREFRRREVVPEVSRASGNRGETWDTKLASRI